MATAEPGWEPAVEERTDAVAPGAVEALHGLFDAPGPAPSAGDDLPPLWHWLAFLPVTPQRELGADGTVGRGTFLPPLAHPRRMYAGARCELHRPVPVGAPLVRRSQVTSVADKVGRSGPMTFVEITHEYTVDGRAAITEVQDLVFRAASPTGPTPPPAPPSVEGAAEPWAWEHEVATDPTLLFRFSALTYNAHRIHYDRDYARQVEGYPDLVVHGPLQAVGLAELCRRHLPGRRLTSFRFRALGPAFAGPPLRLRGRLGEPDRVELAVLGEGGRRTMTAEAVLEPVPR